MQRFVLLDFTHDPTHERSTRRTFYWINHSRQRAIAEIAFANAVAFVVCAWLFVSCLCDLQKTSTAKTHAQERETFYILRLRGFSWLRCNNVVIMHNIQYTHTQTNSTLSCGEISQRDVRAVLRAVFYIVVYVFCTTAARRRSGPWFKRKSHTNKITKRKEQTVHIFSSLCVWIIGLTHLCIAAKRSHQLFC